MSSTACADDPARSDYPDAPANVLFVGNSFMYYNNSLHNHYRSLVRSSGHMFEPPPVTRSMTISGAHLPDHEAGLSGMLDAEDWDVVILQGHSLGPIGETTAKPFREAARHYSTLVREHGGRPVFFMTWAYTGKPEMTSQLDAEYSAGLDIKDAAYLQGVAWQTILNYQD